MSEHLSPHAATAPVPRSGRRSSRRRTRRPVPWALRLCVAAVHPTTSVVFRLHQHADRIPLTDALVLPVAQWGPRRVHDHHTERLHLQLRTPVEHLVGEPIDLSEQRARVRAGAPLTAELLHEVTELLLVRVRNQLGELREERPPAAFFPRPPSRALPGDLPGAAA